jgi:hypothetical protein
LQQALPPNEGVSKVRHTLFFLSVKTDGKKQHWAKTRADRRSQTAGFIIHHYLT